MKTIQHQIEDAPHSANSIWELRGVADKDKESSHSDLSGGDGFYWCDESESNLFGPHLTLKEAKEERDKCFDRLLKDTNW